MAQSASYHTFTSIHGHGSAKEYLVNAIEANVLPHALLFHGPAGVGKLSLAYALVKYLNCRSNGLEGCTCNICRKISEEIFADVLVVGPKGASNTITLSGWKPGKDDPDNLQYYRFLDTAPLEGSRKILLIKHAEKMNVALANYILKVMEEPPPYLTLILLAERKSEMLPTIKSRCASVKLSPLTHAEMVEFAKTIKKGRAALTDLDAAIYLSDGRPAVLLQKSVSTAGGTAKSLAETLLQFQRLGFISLFKTASDLLQIGNEHKERTGQNELEGALQALNAWFRDSLLVKLGNGSNKTALVNAEVADDVEKFAQKISLAGHLMALECVRNYSEFARRQTDRNFVLESLLMEIGKAIRT